MWQYAFCRSSTEEIILPQGIRNIVPYTFKECRHLKRIICNPGLIEIKAKAFAGCSKKLEIVHEEGLKISPHAFDD